MRSSSEAPKSRQKFDFQSFNLERIIDNAAMSKLRTLKLYIISKNNFESVYEYDVIIPRPHMTKEVEGIIEEEHERGNNSKSPKRMLENLDDGIENIIDSAEPMHISTLKQNSDFHHVSLKHP